MLFGLTKQEIQRKWKTSARFIDKLQSFDRSILTQWARRRRVVEHLQ